MDIDYSLIYLGISLSIFVLGFPSMIFLLLKNKKDFKYGRILNFSYKKISFLFSININLNFNKRFLDGYSAIKKRIIKSNKKLLWILLLYTLIFLLQLIASIIFIVLVELKLFYFIMPILFGTFAFIFNLYIFSFKFKRFEKLFEKISFKNENLIPIYFKKGKSRKVDLRIFEFYNNEVVNLLEIIKRDPSESVNILYFMAAGTEFLQSNSSFNDQNYRTVYAKIDQLINKKNQ
ncbi:Uncharacterised protein [Mycoplasmopsis citelli]|uniref:Uncharacterized protein n=1 Tax=Mycoplasmopsis citelli TaxID=171281 RepID=A0A449B1V8_9BACT|nr:Uncharacterised protein [Mycoplasmopsis citelli]